jgi:hypothetical protein
MHGKLKFFAIVLGGVLAFLSVLWWAAQRLPGK